MPNLEGGLGNLQEKRMRARGRPPWEWIVVGGGVCEPEAILTCVAFLRCKATSPVVACARWPDKDALWEEQTGIVRSAQCPRAGLRPAVWVALFIGAERRACRISTLRNERTQDNQFGNMPPNLRVHSSDSNLTTTSLIWSLHKLIVNRY
jgi:hypothetical protein